ncbi:uncharacterized protein LMH87_009107 [Akanthomyces muscarius]|uniref:Peptidase S9 prolyl oligopeptidase catalytic domain-containing protein n=1 Tax=Akanthomyces muscarius TaxID=2231603 RepID=A0A9W8UQB6_AKAMU|nr:uncharacterized protein LMH87_009107 [Akanthomyces muscarius]KAJ4158588.1 hypothetical protein LMH87_009107 [Akanthomyces muscarius]
MTRQKKFKNHGGIRDVANSGFVVVAIDGMGTNWRSKAFLDIFYKNLEDGGFPDRIRRIRAAAAAAAAAAAVLHHGDFYCAACAVAGTHDNRAANAKWAEMYMGWPVDASYAENSNVVHAAKLSDGAALMLVTGSAGRGCGPGGDDAARARADPGGQGL